MNPRVYWNRWVDLLDTREAGTTQALFRIAVGLVTLFSVLTVVWGGLVDIIWVDVSEGGYRNLGKGPWLVAWLGGPTRTVIWSLVWVTVASSALVIVGQFHRVSAVVALFGYYALTTTNTHHAGSYDDLVTNALWLVALSNGAATLSLGCRLRTGSWTSDHPVTAWPRYLMVGQLVLMYFTTGLHKLSGHWIPGGDHSAVYYILQQPSWARWDMTWTAHIYPLTQLMTLATWCFEVGSPLLLLAFYYRMSRTRPGRLRSWMNRIDGRTVFAVFGLGMHLTIFGVMEVGPFTWISLAFYLALWHPDEWRRRMASFGVTKGVIGDADVGGGVGVVVENHSVS